MSHLCSLLMKIIDTNSRIIKSLFPSVLVGKLYLKFFSPITKYINKNSFVHLKIPSMWPYLAMLEGYNVTVNKCN